MKPEYSLRIAHLYAHFLNIYGDRGNILTLLQRARWRGIEITLESIGVNANFDPEYFDLYFIGGGQDKQQQVIAHDFLQHKNKIHHAVRGGAVLLAVCGGYQLLGHYYSPAKGEQLPGIGLIDVYTIAGTKRMIGNVVIERSDGSTLVGFENHSGKTYLAPEVCPLGKVLAGHGNNGEDGQEGVAQTIGCGRVYATYLHGSLLPKNPALADELIKSALARRFGAVQLATLDDALELTAHMWVQKRKA